MHLIPGMLYNGNITVQQMRQYRMMRKPDQISTEGTKQDVWQGEGNGEAGADSLVLGEPNLLPDKHTDFRQGPSNFISLYNYSDVMCLPAKVPGRE
ncbi:unnamed protein product [Hermetia illucens]|uniref:Uncharacterized protein n=1 Tax=Hermetia illucens TaxID=343691 RepID=A0A7R8UVM3_HERIL|nr:unnamed protein product [Hermetia illucens]